MLRGKLVLVDRQKGVALITVLLLMVFLSTFAINMVERQDISIRRIANLAEAEQAYQIGLGGEQWARKLLEADIEFDTKGIGAINNDHAGESWANLGPAVKVEGTESYMLVKITDMHGKLNLNNLIQGIKPLTPSEEQGQEEDEDQDSDENQQGGEEGENQQSSAPNWYSIFKSLLLNLGIEVELADALVDWIDSDDQVTGVGGAEEQYYRSLEVPYLPANRPLLSIDELIRIKGFTPKIIIALAPYVTALPVADKNDLTKVNANTVSAQVLGTFVSDQNISSGQFTALLELRVDQPFESVNDFIRAFKSTTSLTLKPGMASLLDIKGEFFLSHSCADTGRVKLSQSSLLRKKYRKLAVEVIYRQRTASCIDPDFNNRNRTTS